MLVLTKLTTRNRPWASFFWPTLIDTRLSAFNGEIKVLRFWNRFQLVVKGTTQSGGLVTTLWLQVLKQIKARPQFPASPRILVLGLGGGSFLAPIYKYFPQAEVTGIDIDPVMIDLGKQYLSLSSFPHLKIIIADAFAWLSQSTAKYDLILVDLYQGQRLPPQFIDPAFLSQVRHHLKPAGLVCFNLMVRSQSQFFYQRLIKIFSHVQLLKTSINQVYTAG